MFTLNEFRYVNDLLYLCIAINLLYYIVDMSERCIHCGASDNSLTQPEYSKWVCTLVDVIIISYAYTWCISLSLILNQHHYMTYVCIYVLTDFM